MSAHRRAAVLAAHALAASALITPALVVLTAPAAPAAAEDPCGWGDLDGDGVSQDRWVADPHATVAGKTKAGTVWIHPAKEDGGFGPAFPLAQGDGVVPGSPATGDQFGSAIAVEDLNDDGCLDLAVAASGEALSGNAGAGSVTVIFGSPAGLGQGAAARTLTAASTGGSAQANEKFGAVLLAKDADRGQPALLAVGRPGKNVSGKAAAGAVSLFRFDGAGAPKGTSITQNTAHVAGSAEQGDEFGSALGFTYFDLVVGVPGEDGGRGRVQVLTGSRNGMAPTGSHDWSLSTSGVPGSPVAGDRFGAALAVDINGATGGLSVAIGVPGRDVGSAKNAGAIVETGISNRFTLSEPKLITQDTKDVADQAETGDAFGGVISYGICWSDGFRECLVVGIPREDVGSLTDAGAIWTKTTYAREPGEWDFYLSQSTAGVPGSAGAGHKFGAALSLADLYTLWVGVPGDEQYPRGSVVELSWAFVHQTYASTTTQWTPPSGVSAGLAI